MASPLNLLPQWLINAYQASGNDPSGLWIKDPQGNYKQSPALERLIRQYSYVNGLAGSIPRFVGQDQLAGIQQRDGLFDYSTNAPMMSSFQWNLGQKPADIPVKPKLPAVLTPGTPEYNAAMAMKRQNALNSQGTAQQPGFLNVGASQASQALYPTVQDSSAWRAAPTAQTALQRQSGLFS